MKYIKIIIITIIDFFLSLFKTPTKRKKNISSPKEKDTNENHLHKMKKETNTYNTTSNEDLAANNLVKDEISEELKKLFKKYLELISGIKIKDASKEEINEVERIKAIVLPIINNQIKSGYLLYNSEIEKAFFKNITIEIKKKDILPIKKDFEVQQEKQEDIKQDKTFKDSCLKKEIVSKEELVNPLNLSKENFEEKVIAIQDVQVVYKKEEQKKEIIQNNTQVNDNKNTDKNEESLETIDVSLEEKDLILDTIVIKKEKPEETILQREEEIKEEKSSEELTEENFHIVDDIKINEVKIEKQIEEDKKDNHYFQILINRVSFKIKELKELLEKEELNIEDYDYIEENINDLRNDLDTYKILNKLDNQELNIINEYLNNVQDLKESLEYTKKEDYKKEENIQNETLKQEEINRVNFLLQEVYSEHKKELSTFSLNSIDDLSNKTEKEIRLIEKELLKIKLKKAAKVLEPSFLISIPFIKNKYFLYFTTGIFLHNHLGIINCLYDRKDASFKSVNISPLMKASEALKNSISLTEDNLIKVKEIKDKYTERYPDLKYDEDFNKSINKMESKLKTNYTKYVNKENRLKRIKKRSTKINKNIKKKILVKDLKKKEEKNDDNRK